MKLLIITQVVDKEHPILGFFHRWIEEFAKHVDTLHVICLEEGVHSFPANVHVHSLGKEKGRSRLGYIFEFYRLIISLRKEYDRVFVHMNQIYVIMGALLWRAFGKKIGLWYAHGKTSLSLRVAVVLVDIVFTSTKEGLRINTPKRKIVGQGIDTGLFKPAYKSPNEVLQLITVGRISPSKNIETLLKTCALLRESGMSFHFKIVGVATTPIEKEYAKTVKKMATALQLDTCIEWTGAVTNSKLPLLLQQSDIFIHDGATNSLDKVLLEASLCGCIVVSSNPAYRSLTESEAPQLLFCPKNHKELALRISSGEHKYASVVRKSIFQKYDISILVKNILNTY
jgi:glycosyltransferase involved in cell wall biosynthesis